MSDARKRRRSGGQAPRVRVAFACNDPDNGIFWERAGGIIVQVRHQTLELEPSRCRDPRMTIKGDRVRIFRREFPFSASADWVGNWCWNEFAMGIDAAALLLHAALRFGFTATGADGNEACELSDLCDEFPEWDEHALRDQLLKMALAG